MTKTATGFDRTFFGNFKTLTFRDVKEKIYDKVTAKLARAKFDDLGMDMKTFEELLQRVLSWKPARVSEANIMSTVIAIHLEKKEKWTTTRTITRIVSTVFIWHIAFVEITVNFLTMASHIAPS